VIDGQTPKKALATGGGATRPRLSGPGRYDALRAAALATARRVVDPIADLIKRTRRPDANRYEDLRKQTGESPAEPSGLMSDFVSPEAKQEAAKRRVEEETRRKTDRTKPNGYDLG